MERCELVRILRPFFDNLHILETKLKCPVCKNLLEEPKLMPCDHSICRNCLPTGKRIACPKCSKTFYSKDARGSLFMEEMVKVFDDMDDAISNIIKPSISCNAPVRRDTETTAIPPGFKERSHVLGASNSCEKVEATIVTSATNELCNEEQTDARGATHHSKIVDVSSDTGSSCEIVETKNVVSKEEIEKTGGTSGGKNPAGGTTERSKRKREDETTLVDRKRCNLGMSLKFETKNVVSKEEIEKTGGTSGGKNPAGTTERSKKKREDETTLVDRKRCNLGMSLKFETNQREIKFRSTPINLFDDECAFCHSFRTTELYGPMVCFLNGILVKPEEADQENVIYLHQKCLDWAPNVYYSGDNVMNLEQEIERGELLICSKCGIKGAVLGCFYGPCRRSYHATCALEIDCSWDSENFNMLCPAHASEKLKRFLVDA